MKASIWSVLYGIWHFIGFGQNYRPSSCTFRAEMANNVYTNPYRIFTVQGPHSAHLFAKFSQFYMKYRLSTCPARYELTVTNFASNLSASVIYSRHNCNFITFICLIFKLAVICWAGAEYHRKMHYNRQGKFVLVFSLFQLEFVPDIDLNRSKGNELPESLT